MTFSIPKWNTGSHNICSKSNKTIGLTPCPVSEGKTWSGHWPWYPDTSKNHGQGIWPCTLIHLRNMTRASEPVPCCLCYPGSWLLTLVLWCFQWHGQGIWPWPWEIIYPIWNASTLFRPYTPQTLEWLIPITNNRLIEVDTSHISLIQTHHCKAKGGLAIIKGLPHQTVDCLSNISSG